MSTRPWQDAQRQRIQDSIKSVLLEYGPLRPVQISQKINKYSYPQIYSQLNNMYHWREVDKKEGVYSLPRRKTK